MTRALASVRIISKLSPIEGADRIELAQIDGWQVVVKKGEFCEGQLCIYFEIDSWVPHIVAPFLSKEKEPKQFNNVPGNRLRTIKLKGELSQGLALPLHMLTGEQADFCREFNFNDPTGCDLTEILGVQLYEKPLPAQLAGRAKGNFPPFIFKTDQERIQNIKREVEVYNANNETFEVTEKLDGSSITVYLKDDVFGVCSRNLDLQETEGNSFWTIAREYDLETKLRTLGKNIALQGELVGPGIQGNQYGFAKLQMFLFDIFDIDQQTYLCPDNRHELAQAMDIPHVPFIGDFTFEGETIEGILKEAVGESALNKSQREGLVFKSYTVPTHHFKAISNVWLLNEK